MIESPGSRLVALALVLAVLGIALVAFGTLAPNPADGRYPGTTDLVGHEAQYLGQQVVVDGAIVQTDPLVIVTDFTTVRDGDLQSGTIRYTLTDVQPGATVGDRAQVYGTLTDERRIQATNARISSGDRLFMYLASFLAGLWVLARLARQWRLDRKRLAITPREDPLTARSVLPDWIPTTTEETRDA